MYCVKAKRPPRATAMNAARGISAERLKSHEVHCMKAERPSRATATNAARSISAERLKSHEVHCVKAESHKVLCVNAARDDCREA